MSANIDEKLGIIKISDDIIAITAATAALKVKGIFDLSGGISESISKNLRFKTSPKGVKVSTENNEVTIDMYVIIIYGYKIPEVAWNIQERVKKEVEKLTGFKVSAINIHVQGISFEEITQDKSEENLNEEK